PFAIGGLVVDHQDARLLAGLATELEPAQAVDQLLRRHRLDEIVERAERDAQLGVVDHAHDDDWDVAGGCVSLESREHLPAVEVGKKDVERDRGRFARDRFGQGLAAGAGDVGAEAGSFELPRQQLGGGGIVLDHQDEGTRRVGSATVESRNVTALETRLSNICLTLPPSALISPPEPSPTTSWIPFCAASGSTVLTTWVTISLNMTVCSRSSI